MIRKYVRYLGKKLIDIRSYEMLKSFHKILLNLTHSVLDLSKTGIGWILYQIRLSKYPEINHFFRVTQRKKKKAIDISKLMSHPLVTPEPVELGKFIWKHKKEFKDSYTLLNIGIGFNTPPNWLTFFKDILHYERVGSIEIWDSYIWRWEHHNEFPVWKGDVRKLTKSFELKSIDTILWANGPEHVSLKDFETAYTEIKKVAKKHIIMVTPWGNAYDYQEHIHSNPYEKHVVKSPDRNIYKNTYMRMITWGKKNTLTGGLLAYEFLRNEKKENI